MESGLRSKWYEVRNAPFTLEHECRVALGPSRSNLADTARADLAFRFSLQKAYIWQHRQAVLIDRCQIINKQKTEWVLLLNYALLCLWQNSHCLYDLQAHKYCLILGNKLSVLFIMAPLAKLLCVFIC